MSRPSSPIAPTGPDPLRLGTIQADLPPLIAPTAWAWLCGIIPHVFRWNLRESQGASARTSTLSNIGDFVSASVGSAADKCRIRLEFVSNSCGTDTARMLRMPNRNRSTWPNFGGLRPNSARNAYIGQKRPSLLSPNLGPWSNRSATTAQHLGNLGEFSATLSGWIAGVNFRDMRRATLGKLSGNAVLSAVCGLLQGRRHQNP